MIRVEKLLGIKTMTIETEKNVREYFSSKEKADIGIELIRKFLDVRPEFREVTEPAFLIRAAYTHSRTQGD